MRRHLGKLAAVVAATGFLCAPLASHASALDRADDTPLNQWDAVTAELCPKGISSITEPGNVTVYADARTPALPIFSDLLTLGTWRQADHTVEPSPCVAVDQPQTTVSFASLTHTLAEAGQRARTWQRDGYDTRFTLVDYKILQDAGLPEDRDLWIDERAYQPGPHPDGKDYPSVVSPGTDLGVVGGGQGLQGSTVIIDAGTRHDAAVSFPGPGVYQLSFTASQWRSPRGWLHDKQATTTFTFVVGEPPVEGEGSGDGPGSGEGEVPAQPGQPTPTPPGTPAPEPTALPPVPSPEPTPDGPRYPDP